MRELHALCVQNLLGGLEAGLLQSKLLLQEIFRPLQECLNSGNLAPEVGLLMWSAGCQVSLEA